MGFEVTYTYHPKKEEGGYDTSTKEEKVVKVGKPFDEIPLENLAAAIMAQLARRDVWVVDVKVVELARKEVAFKECKDGLGIVLKNRRFGFNEAAQMVAEDLVVEEPQQQMALAQIPPGVQPHELIQAPRASAAPAQNIEDLYSNPNRPVPVQRQPQAPVNQKKVLYKVVFDPAIVWLPEVKRLGLKFTQDKEYPVHQVIPHPSGKLDLQKIVVTDDTGRPITLDEKYFTTVGMGLLADKQLGFSGSNGRGVRKPKLAFEDEMFMDSPDPNVASGIPEGIPLDDGTIPEHLLQMPDIRPTRAPQRPPARPAVRR